ncbi:MAG: dTMP kinase [Bifidobacteriaceae bacterium]|jgi:dTMP kinase|nr:dTMP kinase [Bifidobacteriaceae bacterium]
MGKGLFISFEGGDGTGKSTQVKLFYKFILENFDSRAILTFEPGDSDFGKEIRQIVMHRKSAGENDEISAKSQALLFALDRSYHVDNMILPALEDSKTVITDRYFDSSIAYQGEAGGLTDKEIYDLNIFATGGLKPDITFLLDRDTKKAVRGAKSSTGGKYDRFEAKSLEYHKAIREKYLSFAKKESRWEIINGDADVQTVSKRIQNAFSKRIENKSLGK